VITHSKQRKIKLIKKDIIKRDIAMLAIFLLLGLLISWVFR